MRVIQGIKNLSFVNFAITFLIIRFISIANGFPARTDSDSGSYTSGDGFTNWNWVSFSGSEFGRGWPSVLLFSLVSSNSGRIFILQIINLTAWIFFGYVGGKYLNPKKQPYLYVCLLMIGNSVAGQFWNNWIGRESLAFSLTLFALSLQLLWLVSPPPNSKLIFLATITVCLYSITKPSLIFVSLVQFVFLLIGLHKNSSNWVIKTTSFVFVAILSIYTLVNIGNQDKGWANADPTGRTTKEIAYSYLTSDFNPNEIELRNYFGSNGSPVCATLKQPTTENNLGNPMDHAAKLHSNCDGFTEWVSRSFYSSYFVYSVTHINSTLELISVQLRHAFTLPTQLTHIGFMPSLQAKFIDFFSLCCFSYLILFPILNRSKLKEKRGIAVLSLLSAFSIAFFASILFSLVMLPTHAGDITRQNYVSSMLLRLLIIFMALLASSHFMSKEKNVKIR